MNPDHIIALGMMACTVSAMPACTDATGRGADVAGTVRSVGTGVAGGGAGVGAARKLLLNQSRYPGLNHAICPAAE